jgi:hypothetical protein
MSSQLVNYKQASDVICRANPTGQSKSRQVVGSGNVPEEHAMEAWRHALAVEYASVVTSF